MIRSAIFARRFGCRHSTRSSPRWSRKNASTRRRAAWWPPCTCDVRTSSQSPFFVLSRTFFDRFFASETVTSDVRLRQTLIWVLAFLLTPGFILLVNLFPAYQSIVIRARRFNSPGMVDDWLEYIVFMFVTYSMVTVGLIAAIVGAKIAALGALLAIAAVPVNAVNAFFFAVETADQFGARIFVVHFVAFFTATFLAAVFVFATVVAI